MGDIKNPMLINVPNLISTNRLLLKCPEPGDGKALYWAIKESKRELERWVEWARGPLKLQNCELYCREANTMFFKRESLDFFIFEKKSDKLIGSVGFPRLSWTLSRFELGYWLRSSCTGKGFCVEGVQALLKLAFKKLGAERIEAKINSKNKKSLRVAELCGFVYEGTLRNNTISPTGARASTAIFSLVDIAELKKNRKCKK